MFKADGNGNANSLKINGEIFPLENGITYYIKGTLSLKLYNDNINDTGKAMGNWFVTITTTAVQELRVISAADTTKGNGNQGNGPNSNNDTTSTTDITHRLLQISPKTGKCGRCDEFEPKV